MAISIGLYKTTPFIKTSNMFKSTISCHATTLKMQSGKANMYQILSLDSNDVSQDDIKKAYRHKALEFHPDTCPESSKEESTRRFIEIKLAYETLSDPVSRESYDFEVGLVDANDRRRSYGRNRMACDGFCKKIWETQLQGLKHRQQRRMRRNHNVS